VRETIDRRKGIGGDKLTGHGDNSFQSFRDHGYGGYKGNRESVHAVETGHKECNVPRDSGSDRNKDSKDLGYSIDLFKDSSLLGLLVVDKVVDLSDLSVVTSSNNDTNTGTLGDKSSTEAHVLAVSEGDPVGVAILALNGRMDLLDGDRFTRQGSLLAANVVGLENSDVSRYAVSGTKDDNISGDKFIAGDLDFLSVSDQDGVRRKHVLEGFGSGLGRTFLVNTDRSVQTVCKHNA
jgi:hypothetical protein